MSKFVRRDALKLLSSILAVCSQDHVLYLVQQAKVLPVLFGVLVRADEHKPVKNANVSIKAPSKLEIASYYEHLLSVIWSMLKQLHDCSEIWFFIIFKLNLFFTQTSKFVPEIKTKITQERLIFKLLENDLEKTKRVR
jgi:hypothetical protein